MGQLKIVAIGNSPQSKAQARGKLFEKLMTDVLRHYGYKIERIPSVNYAGMEIDIEGKAIATGIPLYAECKCYDGEVDSPRLQEFFGKYMARWLKDKKCQGLFIALPGINSYAKGYYRENCEGPEITVRLYEEPQILEALFETKVITNQHAISKLFTNDIGRPGDWILLYTDKGFFWLQYVILPGAGIPRAIAIFDGMGNVISDRATLDFLAQLYPELDDFEKITIGGALHPTSQSQDLEEIVEVRGSSSCFEYQFPASPEYFVGRSTVLAELDTFTAKVIKKETSSRGILFEANSGWGKSSVVLASINRLEKMGHFAVAIDSRSATSSQFILRVVEYSLNKFQVCGGLLPETEKSITITGFDGAKSALLNVGRVLEQDNKVLFIFMDQFENVFFLPETLKRITDLLLKVCDAQTNIVLGFSWKTDLIGLTNEFPYQLRDSIARCSNRISLATFSEEETTALLDRLSTELHALLRKDLKFLLSEFSQGYPWLLKKLCAHVKAQREAGVSQIDIASSLLNVEELFQADLRGLSPEEEETLRRISKSAPVSVSEFGEELKAEVLQSLVNRRLIVRIGHKFDVYWDIFRDYLNSGRVPVQENYILRVQVGAILKATKLLKETASPLDPSEFQMEADLTEKSFYNILRDMRLLGLATVKNNKVILQATISAEEKDFNNAMRSHLREKLKRNRLVWRILEDLNINDKMTLDSISGILSKSCPYISATNQTWRTYARTFADWMDFADLAIFDSKDGNLTRYKPGTEIRERHLVLAKRRGGITIPCIQYTPVEKAMLKIVDAIKNNSSISWEGFRKSTITKSLATLEDLGFIIIIRKTHSIEVKPKGMQFASSTENRPTLFAEGALKMSSFATFVNILETHKDRGQTLANLAIELRDKLRTDWKNGTAETNVKIMLDWARHTNLAPGIFAENRRGARRGRKSEKDLPLFSKNSGS